MSVERHIVISPEEAACPECGHIRRMCVVRPREGDLESHQPKSTLLHSAPFTSETEEKLFEEHLSSFHKMIR